MGGHADCEVAELSDLLDQIKGVDVVAGCVTVPLLGRVAAEGEDVLDALGPIVGEHGDDVGAGVALACEVGHRRDRRLPAHPTHQVGGLGACTPTGSVGDADEVGREVLELGDGPAEAEPPGLVLRRKELEREGAPRGEEVGDAGHCIQHGR